MGGQCGGCIHGERCNCKRLAPSRNTKDWKHLQSTHTTNQPTRPSTGTNHRPCTRHCRKGSPGVKTHNTNQHSSRAHAVGIAGGVIGGQGGTICMRTWITLERSGLFIGPRLDPHPRTTRLALLLPFKGCRKGLLEHLVTYLGSCITSGTCIFGAAACRHLGHLVLIDTGLALQLLCRWLYRQRGRHAVRW